MSIISNTQIDALIRNKLKKSPEVVRDMATIMSKEVKAGETRVSEIEVINVGKYYFILQLKEDRTISFRYSVKVPEAPSNVVFLMEADTFMNVAKGKWDTLQAMGWGKIVVKGRDGAFDRLYHSSLLAKMFNTLKEDGVVG